MPTADELLRTNYEHVLARVVAAAVRAARDPGDVRIVAVTKTVPLDRVQAALTLGLRTLGENRVQEAIAKIDALPGADCEWHLIGHLQTNKARDIPGRFAMLQSLDSARLVEALERHLKAPLDVLIEVNIGREPQKHGVLPEAAEELARIVLGSGRLQLRGVMTVAPIAPDSQAARPVFRGLRTLRDRLSQRLGVALPELSMGMTGDFPVAIEEGATMLRLGRALFGFR